MGKNDEVEAAKPENPRDREKKQKCPTCLTPLSKKDVRLNKDTTPTSKLAELTMLQAESVEGAGAVINGIHYDSILVSDLNTLYGERSNYYAENTLDMPYWIIDRWSNGQETFDRLGIYYDANADETLVTDIRAMANALPVESPRKATMTLIADRIEASWNGIHNPLEPAPLPPPPGP